MTEARPAFYALAPGGWRDYVTLLHPPYTAWHLSYVAIGAALAPHFYPGRLAAAAVAFFLAMGIGAHALDELQGRPLATRIPRPTLVVLTVVSLAAAVAIGIAGAISFDLWLLVFVAIGALLVPVYNLELLGGAIHNNPGFALAWGAFPLLTGYFACAGTLGWVAVLAAAYATLSSGKIGTSALLRRADELRAAAALDLGAPRAPARGRGRRDRGAPRRHPRAGDRRAALRIAGDRATAPRGGERRARRRAARAPVSLGLCARSSNGSPGPATPSSSSRPRRSGFERRLRARPRRRRQSWSGRLRSHAPSRSPGSSRRSDG